MCITRVGRVAAVSGGRAQVEFFDGREMDGVDVSVIGGAEQGAYVEVYGNLALSTLTSSQARKKKAAWEEVMRAAGMPLPRRGGRR